MEVVSQLSTPITKLLPCGLAMESLTQPCPLAPHAPTGSAAFWLLHRAITASVSEAGFCFQPLPILKTLPRARVGEEGEDEGDLE